MYLLYNFRIFGDGINFEINEGILSDMRQFKLNEKYDPILLPLVTGLTDVLSQYKHLSKSDLIFTARILDTNELDVTLSKGLGQYIDEYTKNELIFYKAKEIAIVFTKIMGEVHEKLQKI